MAELLVRKKAAACVSMKDGLVSYYLWKGKLESSKETLVMIKASKKQFKKIERIIKSASSYDLPEIISLPIQQASREYLSWMSHGY